MSSLASETRAAVRGHPFLHFALRADVVNYTAAARFLDIGDTEAVTAALRRFADDLPAFEQTDCAPRVSMQSGLGEGDSEDALVTVGDTHLVAGAGSLTGIVVAGDVSVTALGHVLSCLALADIEPFAAAGTEGTLIVVVARRDGPTALRTVERELEAVPAY
ncbi:hypothetical protein [Haladaptatus sp. DJG-WS-42]|uniref:DUF7523 family protein n=1 Tax=Haladaptatus sp. DJG-WS-42 TaxID=3120516 RepID=UPI0030D5702E